MQERCWGSVFALARLVVAHCDVRLRCSKRLREIKIGTLPDFEDQAHPGSVEEFAPKRSLDLILRYGLCYITRQGILHNLST